MKKFILALSALFTVTSSAHAEWVRYQNYKVSLDVPQQWQVVKDLYGMPITVLGPERGGERAVLLVQHTPLRDFKFNHSDIKASQGDYLEGRKEWLGKLDDSEFLSAIPYRKLPDQSGLDGFEIGFRYQLRGHQFEERSVQVNCGGRFYMLKTLSSEKNTTEDKDTLAKLVDQFQCATATAQDGPYQQSPLHEIQDLIHEENAKAWPSSGNFKSASNEQKAQTLEALVEFYKTYDSADEDVNFSAKAAKNPAFAAFKARLFSLLPGANADAPYNCFFGGWPSRYVTLNGKTTCDYPANQNPTYPKDQCQGQMACNPSLFGNSTCIDISDSNIKSHVTMACDMKFKASGNTFEKLVAESTYDSTLLEETIDSAKKVCTQAEYNSSNQGLCKVLEEKLNVSISSGKHQAAADDQAFIDLEKTKQPELEGALKAVNTDWANFEHDCIDDKGNILQDKDDCAARAAAIADDMEKIDKTDENATKIISQHDNPNNPNKECKTCSIKDEDGEVPDGGGACTPDDLKKKQAGQCQWSSVSWWLNTGGSCAKNLFMSLLQDLWSTVKGIGDLVVTGVKAVGHWFKNLFTSEDDTANKAHQASQTSDSFLTQLIKHPKDTVANLLHSIMEAIINFAREDLLCQSWSGSPHFSKCLAPANFNCLPCTTIFNGVCSLAGYAIGEVLPAFLTGGASALAKDGALAARMGSVMGKASKEGKLLKFVGEIESKIPKLAKLKVTKIGNLVEKTSVAIKSTKAIKLIKTGLQVVKDFKAAFKTKLGNFAATLKKMKAVRASYNVAKKTGLVKIAKVTKNIVVGTAKFTKKVVTLPLKPYEYAYKLGFKSGEKIANKAFVKAMKLEATEEAVRIASGVPAGKPMSATQAYNAAYPSGAASKPMSATAAYNAAYAPPRIPVKAGDIIFPQATRIAEKTAQVENDLKAFKGFKFDSKKAQQEAADLMKAQRTLVADMKNANEASKVSKGATAENRVTQLEKAKEASKKLKEMNDNTKKLLKLVRKEKPEFKLVHPTPLTQMTKNEKFSVYSGLIKKVNQVNGRSEDVQTRTDINYTVAEIASEAKKDGITPAAEKTKLYQEHANEVTQVELRDKMLNSLQPLTKADTDRLTATGMTADQMTIIVTQSLANQLTAKIQAGQALTQHDQDALKYLGTTEEEFKTAAGLNEQVTEDPTREPAGANP